MIAAVQMIEELFLALIMSLVFALPAWYLCIFQGNFAVFWLAWLLSLADGIGALFLLPELEHVPPHLPNRHPDPSCPSALQDAPRARTEQPLRGRLGRAFSWSARYRPLPVRIHEPARSDYQILSEPVLFCLQRLHTRPQLCRPAWTLQTPCSSPSPA